MFTIPRQKYLLGVNMTSVRKQFCCLNINIENITMCSWLIYYSIYPE